MPDENQQPLIGGAGGPVLPSQGETVVPISEPVEPHQEIYPGPSESVLPPSEPASPSLGGPPEPMGPTGSATIFHLEEKSKLGQLKKWLPILLVLVLLFLGILVVFKLITSRFQKPKEVTLTYWGLWEPETVMKSVLDDWEKAHPNIKISYSQQSPKEYRERLQSALARGAGPDLFRFHITWVPMFKNELDPLPAEIMSASQFENTFYPVASNNLRVGTSFLGLPLEIDTLALFYNQKIFQAAGKTPPVLWDELRKLALELTTRDDTGKIQTAGVALGTTSNVDHWPDILGLMMLQNGVDLTKPTGTLAEDALTYFTIFNKVDQVWDETLPNSTFAFATGKVAMYLGFSWDIFEIKRINPSLDFRVAPAPQLPGGNITWASFWAEGVNKKSEHKKEAWEFLQFLSSKETMQKLYQAQSQIRLFGEPYSKTEMAGLISSNPLVAPFVNQAAKAKTWYLSSRTFDNGLNDRMIKYFEDAVNGVNSGKEAAEALKTTIQGVSQLLSQYELGSSIVR